MVLKSLIIGGLAKVKVSKLIDLESCISQDAFSSFFY